MVAGIETSRRLAQRVWAPVWLDERGRARRSNLVIMERASDASRRGLQHPKLYSSHDKRTPTLLASFSPSVQDNPPVHISRAGRALLVRHHIRTVKWAAYSLNVKLGRVGRAL
jgi:hypothetical protein